MPTLDTRIAATPDGLPFAAAAFLPELLLCAGFALLLALRRGRVGLPALLVVLAALALTVGQWLGRAGLPTPAAGPGPPHVLFGGMLVFDHLTLFLRGLVLAATALVIGLTLVRGVPGRDDPAGFHALLFAAAAGLCLVAAAGHLLVVYLGLEMASLPACALVGFRRGERRAGAAALRYAVYGGVASAVMLYGISLLAGRLGTGRLPEAAAGFAAAVAAPGPGGADPVLVIGALFFFVGVAAKLAAVPFHAWCPDVFGGTSAEVAGFLAVAPVAAAAALLARATLPVAGASPAAAAVLAPTLAAFAALTATVGNLAALRQTSLKRLLAYSTVAQSGYLLMGLTPLTPDGVAAVLFSLGSLLPLTLGAFAVVAFLADETGSDDLADWRGLARRSPRMVLALALFLLGLAGLPLLPGFASRLLVLGALYDGGRAYAHAGAAAAGAVLPCLLAVGVLNGVLGAVVSLRVLKVMVLEERVEDLEGAAPVPYRERPSALLYAWLLAAASVALGLAPGPLAGAGRAAADRLGAPQAAPQTEAGP